VQFAAEKAIYDLAKEFKYDEVITAINENGKERRALLCHGDAADLCLLQPEEIRASVGSWLTRSRVKNPKAVDLMIVRAELMLQLGRKAEAVALWEKVAQEKSRQRLRQVRQPALAEVKAQEAAVASPGTKFVVHSTRFRHRCHLQPCRETQNTRKLSPRLTNWRRRTARCRGPCRCQRLYSLQAMGGIARANALAAQMAAARPDSVELSVMRSDMAGSGEALVGSLEILKDIKDKNPNTPVAKEADRRLREFPGVANVDKLLWARPMCRAIIIRGFDSLIGYGYIRAGTYFDHARWLQPYLSG